MYFVFLFFDVVFKHLTPAESCSPVGQSVMLSLHTNDFTVQKQDHNKESSASSAPCPELEKPPKVEASVSKPVESAPDSSSSDTAPEPTSSPPALSGEEERAQSIERSAEAIVKEVLSTAEEILSAPDSPQKEFHSAVLRALSKEPVVEEEEAPGTTKGSRVTP